MSSFVNVVSSRLMPRRRWGLWGCAAGLLTLIVVGCTGGRSTYEFNESLLAQRFLPAERTVDHHPDSVRALQLVENENQIKFELDGSYQSLMTKWSATARNETGRIQASRSLSFATLWSKELSLTALQNEMGVTGLTKDKARDIIARREASYDETLQVDVYWFGEGGTLVVAGPGSLVELRDDEGNVYRAVRTDYSPIREAYVEGGRTALYRRNTFWFDRTSDEHDDILTGTDGVRLIIRPGGTTDQFRFAWRWDEDRAAER